MNPNDWRDPFKTGVPVKRPIEVVIRDEEDREFVITAVWDGENWKDPSGFLLEDYGHEHVLLWRPQSLWPRIKR